MKALVQNARGEPADALAIVTSEDQLQPAAGTVLIDVKLTPVHYGDIQLIRSQPGRPEDTGPIPRGSEAVGVVRALGADVEGQGKLSVGDRVIAFPAPGAWADRVTVPASFAVPVPADLSDEVAAQLLINYVTARTILRALRKSVSGDTLRDGAVLVTGAGTAVARLLMHLLRKEGLRPIGLARSTSSAERITEELGGIDVAATEDADWQARVTSYAGGRKIVGALDCVSGSLVGDYAPLLADDAAIVAYGNLGTLQLGIGTPDFITRQFVMRGVIFTRWFAEISPDEQQEDIRSAFEVARELPSVFKVAGIFDLADFAKAISAVEAPNRDGFVLIRP